MKKCVGCGAILQYTDKRALGYTENENQVLCQRCFQLKNYGTYKKVSLTNKDYHRVLDNIPSDALILYVTDILSLDCLSIEQFKKVILVITKKDLMPESIKEEKIINYMKNRYTNLLDIFLVSSKTEYGIGNLYQCIIKNKKQSKCFIVGTTNSGKSTLINKLVSLYGNSLYNGDVTVSMYPSTTLDKIEVKLDLVTLIDTPGLINDTNIVHYLTDKEVKCITPKKMIKPKSCQINGEGSIIIGHYARIDYDTKIRNSMVIYVSNALNIRFASLKSDLYRDYSLYEFSLEKGKDIVIPGLGFIKCVDEITLKIYVKNGCVPFSRDNLI